MSCEGCVIGERINMGGWTYTKSQHVPADWQTVCSVPVRRRLCPTRTMTSGLTQEEREAFAQRQLDTFYRRVECAVAYAEAYKSAQ